MSNDLQDLHDRALAGSRSDKASYNNGIFPAGQNGVPPFTSSKSWLKKYRTDFFNPRSMVD